MKQMTLIEMDGFLKGKCIPRDLKVNETNAEYLVRKFTEAQAKCAALAAENAGLKSGAMDEIKVINRGGQAYCVKDGVQVNPMYARGWNDYRAKSLQSDTPATDAFLAEVRASAIPDEATERDLFEEWVMEKIFISKTTLEGLRTDDGYRNSTLSGTDYNGMWSQWKAIRAAQLRQEAAQ
ncbi:hypothetical protein DED54_001172 [Escherichia coli]|nr:hypothetical protein [Escherichia coli]